ncbi:hypothetical protein TRAPUB_2222 [Trametes pubescens]|uniref:BTB domain-containing protein n=1 Tax=Trametes pubescens TaxID=154538 RepID=A0A1M2VHA7_TRAPU|nr:hypothetical protein TRAPUB_2222 [Trametes pubescens]
MSTRHMVDAPSDPTGYTAASYPFDLDTADTILRTSDQVDFRVHRAILAIVSPVFATMFQLPQPSVSQGNDPSLTSLPVVDVSEDSKTLDTLLRLCYPVPKKDIEETGDIILALGAAIKYDMEWPVSIFTRKLEDVAFRDPLHTWTVACRHGSETVARKAATSLLGNQKDTAHRGLYAILGVDGWTAVEGISAGKYHRLDEFLRQQGEVDDNFLLLSPISSEPVGMETCTELQGPPSHFISNIPNSDVICRSSDGVDFEVHRAILSLRSLRFDKVPSSEGSSEPEVVHAPQPPDGLLEGDRVASVDGEANSGASALPIIHFDGDAETLSTILAICYDNTPPNPNLSHLAKVIAACCRYEVGLTAVHRTAQRLWDEQARARPLLAYFTAIRDHLVLQARDAAKLMISHNSLGGLRKYVPIMEDVPAHAYHKLVTYCLSCEHVVQQQLKGARETWMFSGTYVEDKIHYRPSKNGGSMYHVSPQRWLVEHLEEVERNWDIEGQGVDWTSAVGSFALVEKAATRSALCSKSGTIIRELLKIGSTLPHQLAAVINEWLL